MGSWAFVSSLTFAISRIRVGALMPVVSNLAFIRLERSEQGVAPLHVFSFSWLPSNCCYISMPPPGRNPPVKEITFDPSYCSIISPSRGRSRDSQLI